MTSIGRKLFLSVLGLLLLAAGPIVPSAGAQVAGHIFGLTLANNGGSPNTTIDIATGVATDSTNTYSISLGSAFTKVIQSAGSWTAGTGNNGLDTGARGASSWYHVYLIRKDSDGSADILFSLSVSSPTMPMGFSTFRRIGTVRTNGSSNIIAFTQTGDEFIWSTASYDVQGVSLSTTSTLYALLVPSGVKVLARLRIANDPAGSGSWVVSVRSPDESSSQNATFTGGSGQQLVTTGASIAGEILVRTNTSSQVAVISNLSTNTFYVRTVGWFDSRGSLY